MPRVEDLLVYKLVARRPKDLDDAERLLLLYRNDVSASRLRGVVAEFAEALEDDGPLQALDRLLGGRQAPAPRAGLAAASGPLALAAAPGPPPRPLSRRIHWFGAPTALLYGPRCAVAPSEHMHFLVRRDKLTEHQVVTDPAPPLAAGAVELSVDLFGLTANNITYGVLGDSFSYWQFFPERRPGWGRLPVWGFGTVTRSDAEGVAEGDRFYGYFSMSSHVVVVPRRADPAGFTDGSLHRRELNGVYNRYLRTSSDPTYRADTEPQQVVLRPLFATAYFLALELSEANFFGAEVVVFSSASSKLASCTAHLLAKGRAGSAPELVGLTSPRNVEAVGRVGAYDRVVAYDDISTLSTGRRVTFVDMAGGGGVRAAVHGHFGDGLCRSIAVGATHQGALAAEGDLPGPKPEAFFAPSVIKRRSDEWSPAEVQRRLAEGWVDLLEAVTDPSRGWLTVAVGKGERAVARAYDEVVTGRARSDRGYAVALR